MRPCSADVDENKRGLHRWSDVTVRVIPSARSCAESWTRAVSIRSNPSPAAPGILGGVQVSSAPHPLQLRVNENTEPGIALFAADSRFWVLVCLDRSVACHRAQNLSEVRLHGVYVSNIDLVVSRHSWGEHLTHDT